MTYSRIAAALALVALLSGCRTDRGQGSSNPFVRNSATQTALALQGVPSEVSAVDTATPELFPAPPVIEPTAAPPPQEPPAELPQEPSPQPTATPVPVIEPTAAPPPPTSTANPGPTLVVPTLPALSYEARWRLQQEDRQVFEGGPQPYVSSGVTQLWWYDPVAQQAVILGTFRGPFRAQARFRLRGQGVNALEVPYHVNVDYGLTALSPAYLERIKRAGYGDWIEAYVFETSEISPA